MMRQGVLVAFVAMAMLAVAKDAPERKTWRGDFAQFLALIEAAEKAEPFELAALRKRLLGKRVQWMGTLKSFWERRPYFQESFVRVNETTELARVRYYLDLARKVPGGPKFSGNSPCGGLKSDHNVLSYNWLHH